MNLLLSIVIFVFICLCSGSVFASTINYTYDNAGRLTGADYGTKAITYTYDNNGNLLQEVVGTGSPTPQYTVRADAGGTGSGSVYSNTGGIDYDYPATNTETSSLLDEGTTVVLTAEADQGSAASWTDCAAAGGTAGGTSAKATCSVSLDASKTLTAAFALNQTVTTGGFTLTTNSTGCGFYNVAVKTEAQVANDPDFNYPYGLIEFSVSCPAADVTINFPGDITGMTYRKYGPTTPGNPSTTVWYDFTNVTVNSATSVTLHLTDGQLGDDTGEDGIIVDQGGAGQPAGGDPVSVPTMNEWGMIIFMTLAGLGAIYCLSRRRRM